MWNFFLNIVTFFVHHDSFYPYIIVDHVKKQTNAFAIVSFLVYVAFFILKKLYFSVNMEKRLKKALIEEATFSGNYNNGIFINLHYNKKDFKTLKWKLILFMFFETFLALFIFTFFHWVAAVILTIAYVIVWGITSEKGYNSLSYLLDNYCNYLVVKLYNKQLTHNYQQDLKKQLI